jgi:hypothetical protein
VPNVCARNRSSASRADEIISGSPRVEAAVGDRLGRRIVPDGSFLERYFGVAVMSARELTDAI